MLDLKKVCCFARSASCRWRTSTWSATLADSLVRQRGEWAQLTLFHFSSVDQYVDNEQSFRWWEPWDLQKKKASKTMGARYTAKEMRKRLNYQAFRFLRRKSQPRMCSRVCIHLSLSTTSRVSQLAYNSQFSLLSRSTFKHFLNFCTSGFIGAVYSMVCSTVSSCFPEVYIVSRRCKVPPFLLHCQLLYSRGVYCL